MKLKLKNNLSGFTKSYLIYVLILAVLLCAIWLNVRSVMIDYEGNTPEAYAAEQLKNITKKGNVLAAFLDTSSKDYCKSGKDIVKDAAEKAKGELKFENNKALSSAEVAALNVYSDDEPFMTIGIKQGKITTKLGMLSMVDWTLDFAIIRDTENGFSKEIRLNENRMLSYTVSLPEGFRLTVNNIECTDAPKEQSVISDFKDFAGITDVPVMNVYEFSNLAYEPVFSAKNNAGEDIELIQLKVGVLEAKAEYKESEEAESLINSIADPLEIAKTWSMFMTDDIGGAKHGLNEVREKCMLLEGSALATMAKNWASNVDIQFVSEHTIKSWEGENVSNYIKYNDNLLSCDVYVEKKMALKSGAPRIDIFSNRMYYANSDGSWYLVDMQSIK